MKLIRITKPDNSTTLEIHVQHGDSGNSVVRQSIEGDIDSRVIVEDDGTIEIE